MLKYFVPLVLLFGVGGLFWYGLSLNPALVPSPLIGKPAPAFELPLLDEPGRSLTEAAFKGEVTMVHVWATWCVSCRAEHPLIMEIARSGLVPIVGLNYKDDRDAALRWLRTRGDPYDLTLSDSAGRVAIDWGVYGTPETFIVDRDGVIRYKHVGPLTRDLVERDLVPLLGELDAGGT